jgi:hypothetical protein
VTKEKKDQQALLVTKVQLDYEVSLEKKVTKAHKGYLAIKD